MSPRPLIPTASRLPARWRKPTRLPPGWRRTSRTTNAITGGEEPLMASCTVIGSEARSASVLPKNRSEERRVGRERRGRGGRRAGAEDGGQAAAGAYAT